MDLSFIWFIFDKGLTHFNEKIRIFALVYV